MTITDGVGRVLVSMLVLVFGYLCGAFVAWDFNAGNWTDTARELTLCMSLAGGISALIAPFDFEFKLRGE